MQESQDSRQTAAETTPSLGLTHLWPLLCVAALLGFTFRLYRDQFFWLDDFANLYWVQLINAREMFGHLVNPFSDYFRPVGMSFYWLLLRCCDLDVVAYHGTAWAIHTINTALVFLLLRRVVGSTYPAAVGASLFAFQAVFHDVYWSFGTIFELLSTLLFLLALYAQHTIARSIPRSVCLVGLFVLAYKAKEMAITLPAILLLGEALLTAWDRHPDKAEARKSAAGIAVVLVLAAVFAWDVLSQQSSFTADDSYYMSSSPALLIEGYWWYIRNLVAPYAGFSWLFLFALLPLLAARTTRRKALFFLLYVAITLAPVIPIANHRFVFYWYLPLFGIAGLAALAGLKIEELLNQRLGPPWAKIVIVLLFSVFVRHHYFLQKEFSSVARIWGDEISNHYRAFIYGLRALPEPPANATFFFDSMPEHFSEQSLLFSVQVAFRRPDIQVKLSDEMPTDAKYRFRFVSGALVWLPPSGD